MPIDINTNLLAPRQPQNTIPRQDFAAIGQLPSIYREGQLRQGLAKLAPDDFQGMAKLLMQYGKPEQGVQAMQLATALKHQAFEEDLATKTYGLQSEEAKARAALQGGEFNLKLQELQRPYANVQSAIPSYTQARAAVLSPGLYGAFKTQFGAPEGVIRNFAASIADAQGKTGKAAEEFINNSVPSLSDSVQTKMQKLKALEDQAQGVGVFGERVGAGKAQDYVIAPYKEPATQATGAPRTPTAYNQQPAQAAPGEAAQAGGGVPTNPADRKPDTLYTLSNGVRAWWRVLPNGQGGWEPVNTGANQ